MALVIAVAYFAILIIMPACMLRKKSNLHPILQMQAAEWDGLWLLLIRTGTFGIRSYNVSVAESRRRRFYRLVSIYRYRRGAMWWAIGAGAVFLPIAMLWIGPLYKKMGVETVPQALEKIFGKKWHGSMQDSRQ